MPATAALTAVALAWIFWDGIARYLGDQHYQEHFVYLWGFVAVALGKTLRGPFRSRFSLTNCRDRVGLAMVAAATVALALALTSGSSTILRSSLVALLTGTAVWVVASWSTARCMLHGALMLLCFGVPYSFYFPLTNKLRWGVASIVELPATLGLSNYTVQDGVVCFPHYHLAITADCSGVGQALTFSGIAALGVLVSSSGLRRAGAVFGLAILLAWLSNVARVLLFVVAVSYGWTESVDDPTWHSTLGTLAFMPFVGVLVAVLVKTHRPLTPTNGPETPNGRWPVALLIAPIALIHLTMTGERDPHPEPSYFQALADPPGHRLVLVAPSQDADRVEYDTPWLVNARFAKSERNWFDLLHFHTKSRRHLCIHHVADCLTAQDQTARYAPAVLVDGKRWWRVSIEAARPEASQHAYYAFEVAGRRVDDSVSTQLYAVYSRALRDEWDVRLTRVVLAGPLPAQPTAYEQEILTWLGRTTEP